MKGSIRPAARQRACPRCGEPFAHVKKLGYVCAECKTMPNRFYIDLYWNGHRYRIFSDKKGQALDSYQRTQNLLATIQYSMR